MAIGWICLHRGLLDWEWYSDANVSRLFIHCLLRANHKPKSWRGIEIGKGQFWTSLESLSKETGLSTSELRTSIVKLEKTGELASKGQARGRMITVCNYDQYQESDKPVSKVIAKSSQADDKLLTTNNNENNENNENKKGLSTAKVSLDWSSISLNEKQIADIKAIRTAAKAKLTQRSLNGIIKELNKAMDAGISYEESIDIWAIRGWKSFAAEWALNHKGQDNGKNKSQSGSGWTITTQDNNF